MNRNQQKRLEDLLRTSLPPVDSAFPSAPELWPALEARLNKLRRSPQDPPLVDFRLIQVPWFDWALAGGLAVFVAVFPFTIPLLLYCL